MFIAPQLGVIMVSIESTFVRKMARKCTVWLISVELEMMWFMKVVCSTGDKSGRLATSMINYYIIPAVKKPQEIVLQH